MSGPLTRFSGYATAVGQWDAVASGPDNFARRLATYISDPARIRSLTVREYGKDRAPSLERCQSYRENYLRQRDQFASEHFITSKYNARNDNGLPFKPASLVKECNRHGKRDRRIPVLARARAKTEWLRNAKAYAPGPSARDVISRVADYFGLTPNDIIGSARNRYVVSARFVAIRMIAELKTDKGEERFSKAHIGRMMGGRDHSTILNALAVFNDRARAWPIMVEAYEALTA